MPSGVSRRWFQIFRAGLDPDIQVASGTRQAMDGEGVGANEQEFNLLGGERGQDVAEVWIHRSGFPERPTRHG